MQQITSFPLSRLVRGSAALGMVGVSLAMMGCGAGSFGNSVTAPVGAGSAAITLNGGVRGGQQPVSGSTIQLYAANQTGYGLTATALISSTVTSDGAGNFGITGAYTCPYATSQVYITATGGNSGTGSNANLLLMAPLGACGNLNSSTFITINELTTVAGAYALSGFMTSPTQLSTSATNLTGLTNGFSTVKKLVNSSTGLTSGTTLPTGATAPVALLDTLADIIASCVNSNGLGGSSTACSTLFTNTTPSGGTAPTDTLTAALNIAKYPGSNTSNLFNLVTPSSPFQPTLTSAPSAYTMSIKYAAAGAFSSPSAAALDSSGNLWVTNVGNNSVTILSATTGASSVLSSGALVAPSAIAFDASGNAWVPNKGNNSVSVFTPAGVGSVALTGVVSAPTGVAVDGQGLVWITNSGNNKVTALSVSGTNISSANNYLVSGGTSPSAIAINPR